MKIDISITALMRFIYNLIHRFTKINLTQKPGNCASVVSINRTDKIDYYTEKRLSLREQEVMEHLIQGKSYKEIAIVLNISTETVKKHASNIYKKTATHNKYELKYSISEYGE